jgi:hypothetical protein
MCNPCWAYTTLDASIPIKTCAWIYARSSIQAFCAARGQISFGSCSTQQGCGKIWRNSCCAMPPVCPHDRTGSRGNWRRPGRERECIGSFDVVIPFKNGKKSAACAALKSTRRTTPISARALLSRPAATCRRQSFRPSAFRLPASSTVHRYPTGTCSGRLSG